MVPPHTQGSIRLGCLGLDRGVGGVPHHMRRGVDWTLSEGFDGHKKSPGGRGHYDPQLWPRGGEGVSDQPLLPSLVPLAIFCCEILSGKQTAEGGRRYTRTSPPPGGGHWKVVPRCPSPLTFIPIIPCQPVHYFSGFGIVRIRNTFPNRDLPNAGEASSVPFRRGQMLLGKPREENQRRLWSGLAWLVFMYSWRFIWEE